jgi:hypothetical protein
MTQDQLADRYQGYIACLNGQDWANLGNFVHEDVRYNSTRIGLPGYRADLRAAARGEPLAIRLYTEGRAFWLPGQRQEGAVRRKCLLRVSGWKNPKRLVRHRQGRHRSAALKLSGFAGYATRWNVLNWNLCTLSQGVE